jgi:Ca-activated chloride channel family protein
MNNRLLALLTAVLILLMFPFPALADGIIIPEPPVCDPCPPPPCPPGHLPCPPVPSPMTQLDIRYHQVDVTIDDQVATTRVDQVFFNPNDWPVEGVYLFPLPADASVSAFRLWVDGEPVEAEILDAEQARQQYRQIVNSLRDPALLEYAGQGAFRAHIFPIPPQGERRIALEYSQVLTAENGLVRYIYPLNTEKFSRLPLEKVAVNVEVRSGQAIRAVYSPSHPVDVRYEDSRHVLAGYEAQNVLPDTDFALYYSTGESRAFHLLTYRDMADSSDADGFFLLLLAPQPDVAQQTQPKDVVLVLDRSGSMEGEKFVQAQDAARYMLSHLNPQDRFNLIAFSTGIDAYAQELQPAAEADQASAWVDRLGAQGSTDINRALLEASSMLRDAQERPSYLIFLTDGLPTEGVLDSKQILKNLEASAPQNLRLFAFGVGYDVDTFLLDSLAQAHHGSSTYVLPGERLDEILSSFYARISTPVLTNLSLDFGDMAVYDLYPSPLPDLFRGSQIVVVGRYREGGTAGVRLEGLVNGVPQAFDFPGQEFTSGESTDPGLAQIARLWATRKIGYLLNRVRLEGTDQETVDQIVRLSIRYGIITPYTSYLVTENPPLGAEEQSQIVNDQIVELEAQAAAPSYGQKAVERAADQGAMAQAEAPAETSQESAGVVRIVGARTFVFSGGKWVDTAYDPQKMQSLKVKFLSDEYFDLLAEHPDLADAFALGQQVIAFSEGVAYESTPADSQVGNGSTMPDSSQSTPTPASGIAPEATPVSASREDSPAADDPSQSSGQLCLGGLAPLLLPVGLLWVLRRRWFVSPESQ